MADRARRQTAEDAGNRHRLQQTVIDGGYCIGCGTCTLGRADGPAHISLDRFGRYQAEIAAGSDEAPLRERVCPFSDRSLNESELGAELFQDDGTKDDPHIGKHLSVYLGSVAEQEFRLRGSSGGFGTWILAELLRNDLVDGIVHVRPRDTSDPDGPLYAFAISRTQEELALGAKSHYYPVEMSSVLREIRETPGRYAVVGVPCFVKSVRLLAREDSVIRERVLFCVGLFCGHLKSRGFAECLSWQCGVHPDNLEHFDFRVKLPDRPASRYGVTATGIVDGERVSHTEAVADLFGSNWGHGYFKYNACDYCDDVVGETADISIGDAWLPEYVDDWRGTNVIVLRHPEVAKLVETAAHEGRLDVEPVEADTAYQSQEAGFRHRRDGLSYRLYKKQRAGAWYPPKRVAPAQFGSKWFRRVQDQRIVLARESHAAWLEARTRGNLDEFEVLMSRHIATYQKLYTPTVWQRVKRRVKGIVRAFIGRG